MEFAIGKTGTGNKDMEFAIGKTGTGNAGILFNKNFFGDE